ncbi:MAG: amino acid racemase [Clostridia bacterium]|nr:amino acid racemase [Clostridia bacterium]
MYKLGIIGGMGPLATQLLYQKIIEKTQVTCDQEHIDTIILSHATVPDRTAAIKSAKTLEVFSVLKDDAKMLEQNGVLAIAIPCNTSHYFYDKLQRSVSVPILNMVRLTCEKIKEKNPNIKKIGLLATDGTVYTGIYKKECKKLGIECINPDENTQKIVMDIIYNQIKVGQKGNFEDFEKIDVFLKKEGCEAAILACTELSCFAAFHEIGDFYVDALDVLCEEAITVCGGILKGEDK